MDYKWIGGILIVVGCGCVGVHMAWNLKYELNMLRELSQAIAYMIHELNCRMTPLPTLCKRTAAKCSGCVSQCFSTLANELDGQIAPEVSSCVAVAIHKTERIPESVRILLVQMGTSLGIFDLDGQIDALKLLLAECEQARTNLDENRSQRMRNYETLGLCAGAALAILLI